ncbi:hypothetical protein K461DRAFT_293512 [Myriangium duriaei CBS 260.36]|uniref:DUF7770 domain-containing protein n=1 Tax=Myriangium duriaei CBS 260.36 TaxID=1168546 RepID=A0A9P4MKK5_9PEZI|nr:hypothetical protein K461DRAFT_293512 [Myriangium duriaei CBS 260.36]
MPSTEEDYPYDPHEVWRHFKVPDHPKLRRALGQPIATYRLILQQTGGALRRRRQADYNHCRAYLLLDGDDMVEIDMECRSDSNGGDFSFKCRGPNQYSSGTLLATIDLAMGGTRPLVREIRELIEKHHLDDYEFGKHGFGCRYWHWVLVRRLAEADYLDSGASIEALDFLSYRYSRENSKEDSKDKEACNQKVQITHGTFDHPKVQYWALSRWCQMQKEVFDILIGLHKALDEALVDDEKTAAIIMEGRAGPRKLWFEHFKQQIEEKIERTRACIAFRTFQHETMIEGGAVGRDRFEKRL